MELVRKWLLQLSKPWSYLGANMLWASHFSHIYVCIHRYIYNTFKSWVMYRLIDIHSPTYKWTVVDLNIQCRPTHTAAVPYTSVFSSLTMFITTRMVVSWCIPWLWCPALSETFRWVVYQTEHSWTSSDRVKYLFILIPYHLISGHRTYTERIYREYIEPYMSKSPFLLRINIFLLYPSALLHPAMRWLYVESKGELIAPYSPSWKWAWVFQVLQSWALIRQTNLSFSNSGHHSKQNFNVQSHYEEPELRWEEIQGQRSQTAPSYHRYVTMSWT